VINDKLTLGELCGVLSLFIDEETEYISVDSLQVPSGMKCVIREVEKHVSLINSDMSLSYNFVEMAYHWGDGKDLEMIYKINNSIYEGNFIRNILRISHMLETIKILADIMNWIELSKVCEAGSKAIIRDQVTVNSLYIIF
jgi:superfamily II RNA helicase